MFGAFTGVLLLCMIQNVLTLAGVPAQWIDALNGAIILVALIVSRITAARRRSDRRRARPPLGSGGARLRLAAGRAARSRTPRSRAVRSWSRPTRAATS